MAKKKEPENKVVRDADGKIVEFEHASVERAEKVLVDASDAEPEAFLAPKTMKDVRAEYELRKRLIVESYNKVFEAEKVQFCRDIGPAINERDKVVSAARRDLDKDISVSKREEEIAVAKAARDTRAAHAAYRRTREAAYEKIRADAHDLAKDVVRSGEVKLENKKAELRARQEEDIRALDEIRAKQEERVRELEREAWEAEAAREKEAEAAEVPAVAEVAP